MWTCRYRSVWGVSLALGVGVLCGCSDDSPVATPPAAAPAPTPAPAAMPEPAPPAPPAASTAPVDSTLVHGQRTKSIDNLRALTMYLTDIALNKGFPPVSGRAFVLWPVAMRVADPVQVARASDFLSPADKGAGPAPTVQDYEGVTKAALKAGGDFRRLTSYVGRRNAEKEYVLTMSDVEEPILADLHFADGAIVAFVSGKVRWLTREELGLGPTDPIVAGEASLSPLLKKLSE